MLAWLLMEALPASALPIGFGRGQGDLDYEEIKTPHFYLYHDKRATREARAIIEALEAGRPKLEQWLGVNRESPLPVIVSAVTANPSFANFIVDAVELQTMGRGGRDLAWHEYTHSTMYRHLDNVFGPAGSIVHLPWMPAWWIEGLAETMSVSGGSDQQYGIERYFALNGGWPSYDKLHSLYDGNRFTTIGYAISGGLVSYIIRTYGAEKLPAMLKSFYEYSMPWWWPWSFVPFNSFMPMDEALREYTGKIGSELYEEYKKSATQYWKTQNQLVNFGPEEAPAIDTAPPPAPSSALALPGQSVNFNAATPMQNRNKNLYFLNRDGDRVFEAEVVWEGDRVKTWKEHQSLPEGAMVPRAVRDDFQIYMTGEWDDEHNPVRSIWLKKGDEKRLLVKRKAYVSQIFLSRDKLIWMEEFIEQQRLCWVPRASVLATDKGRPKSAVHCSLKPTFPRAMQFLGARAEANGDVAEIWLSQSEETKFGDRFKILRWQADTDTTSYLPISGFGKPLAMAFSAEGPWLALADRSYHFLRRIDPAGACVEERDLAVMVEGLHQSESDKLALIFWSEKGTQMLRFSPRSLPTRPCRLHDQPTSPLQVGLRSADLSAGDVFKQNDPWQVRSDTQIKADLTLIANAPLLGEAEAAALPSPPAAWRPRPVFAFPWIGVDAKGYQIGSLSVPLMDHLQNETLTLSALYGVESRFPNIELTLGSNRWETGLSLSVFRRQTWNGVLRNESYYFDEKGFEVNAARYLSILGVGLRAGYKNSYMEPYLGDPAVWDVLAHGYLRELSLGLSKSQPIPGATLSSYVNSNLATKQFNSNYDYEQLGLGLNLSIPISVFDKTTTQSWGVSYSRVRGTRRKYLREAYRPLRTFVPGSGGGLNEINQPILGPGALTTAKYGDTQARAQFAWTYPVIEDMAKLIHIVYLQRLDFTAFFNYGTAWNNNIDHPSIYDAVRAHGYNFDLQADIKGVKVNLGLGTGQVLGYDFEVYFLFGFDALIDQGKN